MSTWNTAVKSVVALQRMLVDETVPALETGNIISNSLSLYTSVRIMSNNRILLCLGLSGFVCVFILYIRINSCVNITLRV